MNTSAFPRYQCHKIVRAIQIKDVQMRSLFHDDALIVPKEQGIAPLQVPLDFIRKHAPQPGGYLVVYEDGYSSYSPRAAFESGYTRTES